MTTVRVLPEDEHNARLVANVHPPDWRNPEPAGRYNLVVVGAGTAGLVTAAVAGSLGARVALVERHLMGGDCLNVGCVPSKAVIRSARRAAEARAAAELGLAPPEGAEPDFAAAMRRMRRVRAQISDEDAAARYAREFGVDVFLGQARFTGPDAVQVDGTTLRFARAVVASGGRAAEPPIEGLAEAGYLTNETLFELTERPARLAVIGGGPIGCEMAQAFRRLGSEVTLFEQTDHVLVREDRDAAAIVQRAFVSEGIELVLESQVVRVERKGGEKLVYFTRQGGPPEPRGVDAILVSAGRRPNVEDLGLEAAEVEYDPRRGVVVDDRLRTRNPRIYAAGDVCMSWKFTHAADAAAKIVVQNALFFGRKKVSDLVMPWCTYTEPEIAHVGLYERDAEARGIALDTICIPLRENNRAVADGEEDGFVKLHLKRGTDRILGGTIVAAHAGEMISQVGLAMVGKLGLGTLQSVIYPYPTQSEALKRTTGVYARRRLTPRVRRLFAFWMRLRR